jgi:cytochrome P450
MAKTPSADSALIPGSPEAAQAFDLANPPDEYFDEPSRFFRGLRDFNPLHRNRDGSALLTRYGDVKAIWRDLSGTVDKDDLFRARWGQGPLLECHTTHMLFRDPPDHDRLRAILNPFFAQKAMEKLAEPISHIVERLLCELAGRREADFVSDFALLLPTEVICMLIGLPFEDCHYLHELGEKIVNSLNPNLLPAEIAAAHITAKEFKDYLKPHLDRVRAQCAIDPGESLLHAFVSVERHGQNISENEIIHTCILMFVGGHGTTMNMLSSTLHLLLKNRDQLDDLKDNPEILDQAIDELLRFVTPIQLQGRRTTRAVSLPSGELSAGTEIVLCAGSANRDERVFEQPDRLMLRRTPNNHIAFGSGIHFCLGRPLARLITRAVFPRILMRFPRIERTGPAIYKKLPRFRSLSQLPLRFS